MKCFFPLIVFLLFTSGVTIAQLTDNFSDGNLDGWEGDINHFVISTYGQLQLNAPTGSTASWLHTELTYADSMIWNLYFKLDFSPSTSNQVRIYLGLTSDDLATASGYYFEIGASGDQDAIDFKYLNNGTAQLIASSSPGIVGSEPVEMNIRVIKNHLGVWTFYDATETFPVFLFATTHDILALSELNTFGIYTKYTDTRRDKFFFDDIHIEPIQPDTSPPQWISLNVINSQSLMLIFSEPLNASVSADPLHYLLTPGNIFPVEILSSGNALTLSWTHPFENLINYTLTISGLKDNAGNVMAESQMNFKYIEMSTALLSDILITEIMADPTPVVQLPDAEYLELYNASGRVFKLSDYVLKAGATERMLPDSLFHPGEYVILTDESNGIEFAGKGRVITVDNFPSLTNSGTTLRLQHASGNLIHQISYTDDWYRDHAKSTGGWSLEMINPLHLCSGSENWSASVSGVGGTPGKQNANWMLTPDSNGPAVVSIFTGNAGLIEIRFNEILDSLTMIEESQYLFNPSLDVSNVSVSNGISLIFETSSFLEEGVIYSLMPFNAFDCLGNSQLTDTLIFGLVVAPLQGDVLINELLFNPASGGSRFIEFVNVSEKFIDLSALSVARLFTNDIYPVDIKESMAPGEIVVLTPDPVDILSRYDVPNPKRLFKTSLPAWDDKSDDAALLSQGEVIDSFTYSSDWHHPVISDQNGVSLERISFLASTSDRSNWHSASSSKGYATPTGVNSQAKLFSTAKPPFSIINRHFSPNDDGFNDFMLIHFELESGNDVGSIWVYDLEGREIHQILSNETLGTSATVQWDGRNAEGLVANMGIYLIFVQLWDVTGRITHFQESVALIKR